MPIARQTVRGSPVEINTLKLGNCSALSSANHSSHPRAARISDRRIVPARFVPHPRLKDPSFSRSVPLDLDLEILCFFRLIRFDESMCVCVCVCGNERNLYEFVFESTRVVYYRYPGVLFPARVSNGKLRYSN